jgi:putative tricarboxylic transport membrane protein
VWEGKGKPVMKRFNNEQVGSAIWLIIGLMITLNATTYRLGRLSSPETGFMPFLAGVAMCFFAIIGLIQGTLKRKQGVEWKPILKGVMWQKTFLVLGGLLLYTLLLSRLGFLLCTVLFLGLLFRSVKPLRWSWVIFGSILLTLMAYGVFELWLKAQLPKSPWGF